MPGLHWCGHLSGLQTDVTPGQHPQHTGGQETGATEGAGAGAQGPQTPENVLSPE